MPNPQPRSKTGCLTCKNRRKKCDEAQPTCDRCKRSGMECLGYSYLDNPIRKPRKPRTKRGRDLPSEFNYTSQHLDASLVPPIRNTSFDLELNPPWNNLVAGRESWLPPANNLRATRPGHAVIIPANNFHDVLPSLDPSCSTKHSIQATTLTWGQHPGPSTFLQPFGANLDNASDISPNQGPAVSSPLDRYLNDRDIVPHVAGSYTSVNETSSIRQTNHCEVLPEYSRPEPEPANSLAFAMQTCPITEGSVQKLLTIEHDARSDITRDDSDTEGVMEVIGPILALDRNVTSNSLPFILSSYLRWITRSTFEPTKIAQLVKGLVIRRCMSSDDARSGVTFTAIVMEMLNKNPNLACVNFSEMTFLENRIQYKLALVESSQDLPPDARRRNALSVLRDIYEMMSIRHLSTSTAFYVRMLDKAAPAHQIACSQTPGTFIKLHSPLLHPDNAIRHFPAIDILLSLSTDRPMIVQHDTIYVPESWEPAFNVTHVGLQWKYGLPDKFLLMLGRMNVLRQDFAPNTNCTIIEGLETQITSFKPTLDESLDPYLKVARMVVQECWRQLMHIYLHMGLRGTDSSDSRVKKALKKFVKLLDGLKPSRIPDIFLVTPISLAGIAARKKRDREIIRQRIQSIYEYSQKGTYVNDAAQILEEIWAMADSQARPAVWSDLRFACLQVTGIA